MKLADYMDANSLTDADMADRLGISRVQASRLRRHLSRPSWSLVERITQVTDGEVTANDFLATGSEAA